MRKNNQQEKAELVERVDRTKLGREIEIEVVWLKSRPQACQLFNRNSKDYRNVKTKLYFSNR